MGDLLQQSEGIKSAINDVKNNVISLEGLYKQALFAITPDQTSKATAEVQKLTDSTNHLIHKTKSDIDNFREGSSDVMRQNMGDSLTKKFSDVLQRYQKSQTEYHDKVQLRMVQKVKIVKPDATQDEIIQSIESGQANNLFQMQTLDQNMQSQAKNALSYINERSREIRQLEVSIRELHQLFVDMAIMVESQGVILDSIEHNVSSAVDSTSAGTSLMRGALSEQKKSRKKMYIILIIIIIVIVVILAGSIGGALSSASKTNA